MPDEEELEELAEEVEETEGDTDSVVVEVDLPAPEAEEVTIEEDGDTTVIVEAAEAAVPEQEVDRWIEFTSRLAALEGRVDNIAQVAVEASIEAANAEAEAAAAPDVATVETLVEAAVEEEAAGEDEEVIEPSSADVHPLFRTAKGWREKRANR